MRWLPARTKRVRAWQEAWSAQVSQPLFSAPPTLVIVSSGLIHSEVQALVMRAGIFVNVTPELAPHGVRTFKCRNDPAFGTSSASTSTRPCRGSLGRREKPNPGAWSHPTGLADEARPRRDYDPWLQASWHDHAVRRPQRPRRQRDRPEYAAPSAPGVHPLPQHHWGASSKAQSDPRHCRQLRDHKHPKVRQWLARHPRWTFHFTPISASWLNAVEGFFGKLTSRRLKRGVFRSVSDLQAAVNRFLEETNSDPKTLRLDCRPRPRPRRCQTRERKVRVDPLACLDTRQSSFLACLDICLCSSVAARPSARRLAWPEHRGSTRTTECPGMPRSS